MKLTAAQRAALDKSVAPARMGTYLAAAGHDPDHARELYLWDPELSVAFMADLAILEVALRNAMNSRLVSRWGERWFESQSIRLDDRSCRALADAWSRTAPDRGPDRIVAQCMFAFWRALLDKGDHVGVGPSRVRCDYETQLWRGVLDKAFPGGKAQAARDGFPLSGQGIRRTAHEAHSDCMRLAGMLGRDLASWGDATSNIGAVLAKRPRSVADR